MQVKCENVSLLDFFRVIFSKSAMTSTDMLCKLMSTVPNFSYFFEVGGPQRLVSNFNRGCLFHMGSTFETSYPCIVPLMLPLGQTRHFVSNPRETNHF